MDTRQEIEELHHAFINLEMDCHRLEESNRELLAALRLCERALEDRDAEAEGYAAKAARAAIAKATGEA